MYHLQVLTPEEIHFDGQIHSLIAPGSEGYLGILTNHAPLIAMLKPGTLVITDQNQKKNFFKVSKGFLEVNHNEAFILVESIQATTPIEIGSVV